mmetsp:Transcript_654/g.2384  ORF Transcript_654/g.2384 Transcript_654/m.2384 type:complete len:1631 (-) Transcript_654:1626-6518(-)
MSHTQQQRDNNSASGGRKPQNKIPPASASNPGSREGHGRQDGSRAGGGSGNGNRHHSSTSGRARAHGGYANEHRGGGRGPQHVEPLQTPGQQPFEVSGAPPGLTRHAQPMPQLAGQGVPQPGQQGQQGQVPLPNGGQSGSALPMQGAPPALPTDPGLPMGVPGGPPMQFGTISFGTLGVGPAGPDMGVSVPMNVPGRGPQQPSAPLPANLAASPEMDTGSVLRHQPGMEKLRYEASEQQRQHQGVAQPAVPVMVMGPEQQLQPSMMMVQQSQQGMPPPPPQQVRGPARIGAQAVGMQPAGPVAPQLGAHVDATGVSQGMVPNPHHGMHPSQQRGPAIPPFSMPHGDAPPGVIPTQMGVKPMQMGPVTVGGGIPGYPPTVAPPPHMMSNVPPHLGVAGAYPSMQGAHPPAQVAVPQKRTNKAIKIINPKDNSEVTASPRRVDDKSDKSESKPPEGPRPSAVKISAPPEEKKPSTQVAPAKPVVLKEPSADGESSATLTGEEEANDAKPEMTQAAEAPGEKADKPATMAVEGAKEPVADSKDTDMEEGEMARGDELTSAEAASGLPKKTKMKRKDILKAADERQPEGLFDAYAPAAEKPKVAVPEAPKPNPTVESKPKEEAKEPEEDEDWEQAAESGKTETKMADLADKNKPGKYTRDFLLSLRTRPECTLLPVGLPSGLEIIRPQLSADGPPGIVPSNGGRGDLSRSNSARSFGSADGEKWDRGGRGDRSPMPGGYRGPPGGPYNRQGSPNGPPGLQFQPPLPGHGRGPPMPGMGPMHGGASRGNNMNQRNLDSKWERGKVLPPAPHSDGHGNDRRNHHPQHQHTGPLPELHRTENKYVVGECDEEERKQREVKSILNKLTPDNFDKLCQKVMDVEITTAATLRGIIGQLFAKALLEPTFCEIYAQMCVHLSRALPEFTEGDQQITFRRVLLNKCQEEFEKGEQALKEQDEQEEENDGKDEKDMTKEELLDKERKRREKEYKIKMAKKRMLGNIRFIGELYLKGILTERIMHECLKKLLMSEDEEDIDGLCKLLTTIGALIDQPKAKQYMEAYFRRMKQLADNKSLPSRTRFMLQDVIEMRANGWQERRKKEGPKKIEEVHREAQMEATRKAMAAGSGGGRRGSRNDYSGPPDGYGRDSNMGRGYGGPPMGRGGFDGEGGRAPMPMVRRQGSEDPFLGPRSGLIAGAGAGAGARPSTHAGERGGFGGPPGMRSLPNRSGGHSDRSGSRGGDIPLRPPVTVLKQHQRGDSDKDKKIEKAPEPPKPTISLEEVEKKAKSTLVEFFTTRDTKEVVECIKELEAPQFHNDLVVSWFSVAAETKGTEHWPLMNKLFISLFEHKPQILTSEHYAKALSTLLDTLEDVSIDTPKMPEHLGTAFGLLVNAKALTLKDVAKEVSSAADGELVQFGIGEKFMGYLLQSLQTSSDPGTLANAWADSGLKLEDFFEEGKSEQEGYLALYVERYGLHSLLPLLPAENKIAEMLDSKATTSDIMTWINEHVVKAQREDALFSRMLLGLVLERAVPDNQTDYTKLSEGLKAFVPLLRPFIPEGNVEVQTQCLFEVQAFFVKRGKPKGLCTAAFRTLYEDDLVEEDAFFRWKDDLKDKSDGKQEAIMDTFQWLKWLEEAEEEEEEES